MKGSMIHLTEDRIVWRPVPRRRLIWHHEHKRRLHTDIESIFVPPDKTVIRVCGFIEDMPSEGSPNTMRPASPLTLDPPTTSRQNTARNSSESLSPKVRDLVRLFVPWLPIRIYGNEYWRGCNPPASHLVRERTDTAPLFLT